MREKIPVLVMLFGLTLLYPMQRWIDSTTPREVVSDESLYFASGETIKRISVGLEAIVADVYWIRTVQYFGRKVQASDRAHFADTRKIRMDLLAPLLGIIVTLDPNHIPAYRFGAIFLPERDLPAAIELLEIGIQNNPDHWLLYQDIGYIYWQSGDYEKAAEWYDRGSEIKGAAWWMRDLAGLMRIRGGSRDVARQIYTQYSKSEDRNIKEQARLRLQALQLLDDLDEVNEVLARYKRETGSCPPDLRMFAAEFRAKGLSLNEELVPIDPHNFPFILDTVTCRARQHDDSYVPR